VAAAEVTEELADGVFWLPLALIPAPELVGARVEAASGSPVRAARLLGSSDGLRTTIGARRNLQGADEAGRLERALREGLGEESFTAEYELGRALGAAEAIAYALEAADEDAFATASQDSKLS
jgi:hypothetical protein